jgi:hypothetical protein
MPKHPHIGQPELQWAVASNGVHAAFVIQEARYKTGRTYQTRETFAQARPTYNGAGLLHDLDGAYVVTRGSFDELRSFDTLAQAKLYIESLYALERAT